MPHAAQTYSGSSAPAQSSGCSPLPSQHQLPHYPPGVKAPGAGLVADSEHGVPPSVALNTQRPTSTVPPQPQQAPQVRPNAFPGSLSDLVASFESVKQKGAWPRLHRVCVHAQARLTCCVLYVCVCAAAPHRMSNLDQVHKLLQGSYSSMPQPQDTEKYVWQRVGIGRLLTARLAGRSITCPGTLFRHRRTTRRRRTRFSTLQAFSRSSTSRRCSTCSTTFRAPINSAWPPIEVEGMFETDCLLGTSRRKS